MTAPKPPGCLTAILKLFGLTIGRSHHLLGELPYRLRDDFPSPAELAFYRMLRLVVKDQGVICPKVNLADLFFVVRPNENQSYRNKVDRKHIDFLICHAETMQPLVGLELDDKSHRQTDRVERDALVDAVFQAASLPLVRVPVQSAYQPNVLTAKLAPHLSKHDRILPVPPRNPDVHSLPLCPKCNVPMVQRTATKGTNAGKKFWGCQNFPKCREIA